MPKKKKRDAAYYRERLRRDHPTVYADLVAGKYPNVRQAAAAAGLIHLPTRADALKRDWARANLSERREFIDWLKAIRGSKGRLPAPIAHPDGRLQRTVATFLANWVNANKSKPGRIMKQIGFSGFDWTLAHAIDHGGPLRREVIDKLGPWLTKNGFR